jgi:hypothetical protein
MIVIIDDKPIEVKNIEIQIGDNNYKLSQSIDKRLNINKQDGDDGPISIYPRYSNEIELL